MTKNMTFFLPILIQKMDLMMVDIPHGGAV